MAEIAGVNPATVRRWLAGSSPIPYAVAQLFRLRCRGVIGPEWEDWAFGADGLLYHPFWRRGFTGRELAGLWFECRQMVSLKARVKQMEKEKQRLAEELDRAEDRAGFYRRQVRLEAQMGLALMRVSGRPCCGGRC